jgi:hypothetical protein
MTEQELRTLVREAIARHAASGMGQPDPARGGTPMLRPSARLHSSHSMFALAAGADGDGACIIEPAVNCNHCGYCKSLGH